MTDKNVKSNCLFSQAILIIDGFSTGKNLVHTLREKIDYKFIHIITKGCLYDLGKQGVSYQLNSEESPYDLEIL